MASKERKAFENILASYWQKIVDDLVSQLEKAYPFSEGSTARAIGEDNANLIQITSQGYLVTITMPDYYQFLDEGVSGAKRNTGISRFKFKDKGKGKGGKGQKGVPNLNAIKRFMDNRGIRSSTGKNTKSGRKREDEKTRLSLAYAIAYKIWERGLEPTNFYSSVINDKEIIEFEKKILVQYRKYILSMIDI